MTDRERDKPVALFVWGHVRPGGAERRFLRLFAHLREVRGNVYLYTSESGAAACEALGIPVDRQNVRIFPEPKRGSSRWALYIAALRQTVSLLMQVRRDGIRHLHFGENPSASTFLYGLMSKFGCPFSVSLVNSTKNYERSFRTRMYVAATARFCKYIDCLSTQIRNDLLRFIGQGYAEKLLVSPCSFTDLEGVVAAGGDRDVRDIDIALVSRMTSGKGHTLLRDALLELEGMQRRLVVHICGSGPLEPSIRQEFEAVRHHVVNIHFAPDPFVILRRAKIYVSLQDVENYPSQSLLEAMASRCAVVATDVGLTRQLLDDSCALLVPKDPARLAQAVAYLLDREALRRDLGRNARNVVLTQHTVGRFAAYFTSAVFGDERTKSTPVCLPRQSDA